MLSIGQKSSLALEPSWSGEGGMRIHRRHPKLPMFRLRKEVGQAFGFSLPKDGSDCESKSQKVSYAEELSKVIFPVCPLFSPWKTDKFIMLLF